MENTTLTASQAAIEKAKSAATDELDKVKNDKKVPAYSGFTKNKTELENQQSIIDAEKMALNNLMDLKKDCNVISLAGNLAAEIAKETIALDVVKKITEAAKSIKMALDSIEKTYPEASAMQARVVSVDEVDDEKIHKLVNDYSINTKKAAKTAEDCKNEAQKIAIYASKQLNNNKDLKKLVGIPDLNKKIQAISKDLDAVIKVQQKQIDDSIKKQEALNTEKFALSLEKIKSELEYFTIKEYVDYKEPEETIPTTNQ